MLSAAMPAPAAAEPSAAALKVFDRYVTSVEAHLHRWGVADPPPFQASAWQGLRAGGVLVEEVKPTAWLEVPGAMLHHWRAASFAPGARVADLDRVLRDFGRYPQRFSPQVVSARGDTGPDGHLIAHLRVRQKHVLTVVLDAVYDVDFVPVGARAGYSESRSTGIAEVEQAGTAEERRLSTGEDHGFLWRQNTYWRYWEADGGVYVEIESVSLSRSIPAGLAWAVTPFVENVPKESLEFTLRSVCNALRE